MAKKKKQKPNFKEFSITNPKTGQGIDVSPGVVEWRYYESILSNHITSSLVYGETGNSVGEGKNAKDLLNGLPVRGGEPVRIRAVDDKGNELKFIDDGALYVNRVKNVIQDTKSTVGQFDFCTKEYLSNEMTRCTKRYSGKISESVTNILKNVLEIPPDKIDVEETANAYNFIANDRKPFYTLTWLGTKSIPTEEYGKTAGFFFFQTREGFKFKSADTLVGPTQGGGSADQKSLKKFEYTNMIEGQDGFEKIINYNLNQNIDLQGKLFAGSYDNISYFINPYTFNVDYKEFNISKQSNSVKKAGTELDFVMEEFREEKHPTRGMTMVLDVGAMPSGSTGKEQVERWKKDTEENPDTTNDKVMERVVQSIMRYNQLFSVNIDVMIEGDFSLKAGDIVYCEFPGLGAQTKRPSKESSGIYLIASVCHKVTSTQSFTSMNLIRDSFGKKGG